MTEQQASPVDVTTEISDQEVDKFFASGGEEEIGTSNVETQPIENKAEEKVEDESKADDQADKDFNRNYKAAMHEEREKRKELQRQIEEVRTHNQRLQDTFQKIITQAQQQQQQANAPNFDEDPLAALRYEQQKIKEKLEYQHQTEAQRQAAAEVEMKRNQFLNAYRTKASEFAKEAPDFHEAYQYVNDNRVKEYMEAGYSFEQANQLLQEDEAAIVAKAFEDGVNPAERIYKLAKHRGYKQAVPEQPSPTKVAENKLNQLERGLNASKTLSNAGGKTTSTLTLEAVAAMDDDEFAALTEQQWFKLMKQG